MSQSDDQLNRPIDEGEITTLSSASGEQHTFRPGETIGGDYRLESMLGRGGMGIVFACHHVGLNARYAIKILSGVGFNQEIWNRFQAEAQVLARLNHPAIVRIYNMGVDQGQFPYYVMDLLDGQPLDRLLAEQGPMPIGQALDIFMQVADALAAAHAQGVIHRDIKPSNLMLLNKVGAMSVKLVDFGIARHSKQTMENQSQTKTGSIMGTPYYMSPEQCQGTKVDNRSDVYSLGCSLFQTLTGVVPIRGENAFQTFLLHQTSVAPSLSEVSEKSFPESLEMAMAKMLAKQPRDRYQNMEQLRHDLERIKQNKAIVGQEISEAKAASSGYSGGRALANGGLLQSTILSLGAGVVVLVVAGVMVFAMPFLLKKQAKAPVIKPLSTRETAIETVAATPELKMMDSVDLFEVNAAETVIQRQIEAMKRSPGALAPFKIPGRLAFRFPDDIVIGFISIADRKPVPARGIIPYKKGDRICMYTYKCTAKWPEFLTKFSADDLNGVQVLTNNPMTVLPIIKNWHKLDELSFFNQLVKAPIGGAFSVYEESNFSPGDLREIDQLKNLRSLGLCSLDLSGKEVVKMRLFKTVSTLKLKTISDITALLHGLADRDNIHELWLIDCQTDDAQLAHLIKMKNLETLHLRHTSLTPKSADSFSKMPALKHLVLDVAWTAAERKEFLMKVPVCVFEPPTDTTYWQSPYCK